MKLTSLEYLLFFTAAAVINYGLPRRSRWIWLLLASLAFCLLISPESLMILIFVSGITYVFGLFINPLSGSKRTIALFGGLLANVIILAAFKYTPIFRWLQVRTLGLLREGPADGMIKIALPLGLSFFIFTALSYLIDLKRGRMPAEKNFFRLSAHLLFFPKLAQGPIERAGQVIPQLRDSAAFDQAQVTHGLKRMLWGFFKKMVVADRLAIYVDAVFNNIDRHNGTTLFIAAVFYSLQIYADFSGYTDIALGSAEVLGVRLSENFRRPYFSRSIHEFWSRWHISLSTWLRDYVYLPLAYLLSRKMRRDRYAGIRTEQWLYLAATLVTFLICGLWHGEGRNFVLWGLLYGIYLVWGRWTQKVRSALAKKMRLPRLPILQAAIKMGTTYLLVTAAWIFFRAPDFSSAILIIKKLLTSAGFPFVDSPSTIIYSVAGILGLIAFEARDEFYRGGFALFKNKRRSVRQLSYAALVIAILLFGVFDGGQFIYFQF